MAKKRAGDKPMLVAGISEASQKEALEKARAALSSGDNIVNLPVAGGGTKKFELITIPHNEIDARTVVAPENKRKQKYLNEVYCSDILETIEITGQQQPAIGQFIENDIIETADGSRRRFSCKFAKKDYLIYATREGLSRDDVAYLSKILNVSKGMSLYEQGEWFEQLLIDDIYSSPAEVAKGEGIDKAIVSVALQAYHLPVGLIDMLPSIDALGRPSITFLTKALKSLNQKSIEKLMVDLVEFDVENLKIKLETRNGKVLNKVFMDTVKDLMPVRRIKPSKMPVVASHGSSKVEISRQNKSDFSLNLTNVDEDKKALILAKIKEIVESTQE